MCAPPAPRSDEPDEEHLQTLTVRSKGQITISADARRKLGIDRGAHLLEIVVGDCLLYVPEHAAISQVLDSIRERFGRRDLTVEQLLADLAAHRPAVMQSFYPDIDFTEPADDREPSH
ncbi:MAG: AbrB/MazE/SpoVT family DNA-binding domain-containing protein [Chloroflexi bacterium]|nr:AbrB/MazE/SpoVT family DNA-binding domain-containing protein [Chloroflexota bacterium]